VTNLANGRSVVVRINDRGPFVEGRALDVSRGAARALGMLGKVDSERLHQRRGPGRRLMRRPFFNLGLSESIPSSDKRSASEA